MTNWTNWIDPRPEHSGEYAYVEQLPQDAPPVLLRFYRPMDFDKDTGTFSINLSKPLAWEYWTVAGWAKLTSRVCICERPEEE